MIDQSAPYFLTALDGPAYGREFLLMGEGEITVGRTQENDIVLPDDNISRFHANFWIEDFKLFVQDIGSKNGIFVNEERVRKKALKEGDIVRIGTSSFQVGIEKSPLDYVKMETLFQKIKPQIESMILKMGVKKLSLYGTAVVILFMMFFSLPKMEKGGVSPQKESKILKASFAPIRRKRASEEEIILWQAQADQAFRFNDYAAAIPLLRNVLAAAPNNPKVISRLDLAQNQLLRQIQKYSDNGDREYEKMYYERAIQEWEKVLSLTQGIEPNLYQLTSEKIQNVQTKLLQKRS